MGRWIVPLIAAWGVVLPTASASSSSMTELPDAPVAECVEASQSDHETREDTTLITLDNTCSVAVRCQIGWTVECKNGQKHSVARAADIAAGANRIFEASASMCSEAGWRISPAKWSCASR